MSLTLTSPVTGSAQTGFTSPGYTVVADASVPTWAKAWVVSALSGTQGGVRTHTPSDVFHVQMYKPSVFRKMLAAVAGVLTNQPKNVTGVTVRKGVLTAVGNVVYDEAVLRIQMAIPSGAETADAPNCRAMMSLGFGIIAQQSANIGDTVVTQVL